VIPGVYTAYIRCISTAFQKAMIYLMMSKACGHAFLIRYIIAQKIIPKKIIIESWLHVGAFSRART
jgi:hypothetical protein